MQLQESSPELDPRSVYYNVTPVYTSPHWLPMNRRIDYKILSLTCRCLHGAAPSYQRELITPLSARMFFAAFFTRPGLCISGLDENTNKKRCGARAFEKASPTLWNNLPDSIRKVESIQGFRRLLKTHLSLSPSLCLFSFFSFAYFIISFFLSFF